MQRMVDTYAALYAETFLRHPRAAAEARRARSAAI
jgi:hypothetical protein